MSKNKQGFTLIEAIITLGVMGSVTVIGIPVLMDIIEKADRQAALVECRNAVQTAMIAGIVGEFEGTDVLDAIRSDSNVKGEICTVEWHDNGEVDRLVYKKKDITVTYSADSQVGENDVESGYHVEVKDCR